MNAALPKAIFRDQRLVEGVIANLPMFRGATPASLAAVASRSWAVAARRGERLFDQGGTLPGAFAVAYGQIKLIVRGADASATRVLRLVSAGEAFGTSAALLGRPSRYAATALADSRVIVIPAAAILSLLEADPRCARGMVTSLAESTFALLQEIESATLHGAGSRLAAYLEKLAGADGTPGACTVRLPVSKSLIAARLGMKKETLSRLLRGLADRGLIAVAGAEIQIRDRPALALLAA